MPGSLDEMTFEELLSALEQLTERMAAGDIGIEEAAAPFGHRIAGPPAGVVLRRADLGDDDRSVEMAAVAVGVTGADHDRGVGRAELVEQRAGLARRDTRRIDVGPVEPLRVMVHGH